MVCRMLTLDELRGIINPIAKKYGVGSVILFGSAARGDYTEESDYDFCVDPGDIRSGFKFAGFYAAVEDAVGREVDMLSINALGSQSEFLRAIRKEGIVLYERE